MLSRNQEAPIKEGFHNKYNTDNMNYQIWLLTK